MSAPADAPGFQTGNQMAVIVSGGQAITMFSRRFLAEQMHYSNSEAHLSLSNNSLWEEQVAG